MSAQPRPEGLIGELRPLDPLSTIGIFSAFALVPQNSERLSMIHFGIRLAGAYCSGTKKPSIKQVRSLLSNIGQYYKSYSRGDDALGAIFSGQALFTNWVEANTDQTVAAIWKRFERHQQVLERDMGFNVATAIYVTKRILFETQRRMEDIPAPLPNKRRPAKRKYYDFAYFKRPSDKVRRAWTKAISFTTPEIQALVPPHIREKVMKYLEARTLPISSLPKSLDPLSENVLVEFPFIKSGGAYPLPIPPNLLHGLSLRLHRILAENPGYVGEYKRLKGGVLEEWAAEEFRLLFLEGTIFRNVAYQEKSGKAEADIIISYKDYLIFVECTTKWITPESWKGEPRAIQFTLAKSVRKCYLQALRAKRAYVRGDLKLKLSNEPKSLMLFVLTDTLYPNLLAEHSLSKFRHLTSYLDEMIVDHEYPYIINIFDLETLRHVTDTDTFLKFVTERLELYQHPVFLAQDEWDYFVLYSKPEYGKIKSLLLAHGTTLNYVQHNPPPVSESPFFFAVLDAIGSEQFTFIRIGERYDRTLVTITMNLIYDIYNSWDATQRYFIFSREQFDSLLSDFKRRGTRGRLVVWEGLPEYFELSHRLGDRSGIELERRMKDGSIGENLDALATFHTDIFDEIMSRLPKAKRLRRNKT